MHPSRLLQFLGEPGTGRPIDLVCTKTSNGEPFEGWLLNESRDVVGRLSDFRFDFVHFVRPETIPSDDAIEADPRAKSRFLGALDGRFVYEGDWISVDGFLKVASGRDPKQRAHLTSSASRVDIQFHSHQWSGRCRIIVNGRPFSELDLFCDSGASRKVLQIENPTIGRPISISMEPLCQKHPNSDDFQLIIEGALEYSIEKEQPSCVKPRLSNRGAAAFELQLLEHMRWLPPDALVLDVGGGRRQLEDPRYVNLEYTTCEEADIWGDGQALPFKSDSVDLVYCTGVLEHIPNPMLAAREIHRILKPGGRVLACVPFLQPLHNEPQHFFNASCFGLAKLFDLFAEKNIWSGGNFSATVKWIAQAAGIESRANPADWAAFCELMGKFDHVLPEHRLKYIASVNWVDGVKH